MDSPAMASSGGPAEKPQIFGVDQALDPNSDLTKESTTLSDLPDTDTQPVQEDASPMEIVTSADDTITRDTDLPMDMSRPEDLTMSQSLPAVLPNALTQSTTTSVGNIDQSFATNVTTQSSTIDSMPSQSSLSTKPKSMFSSLFPPPKSRTPTPPTVNPTDLTIAKSTSAGTLQQKPDAIKEQTVAGPTPENLLAASVEGMEVSTEEMKTATSMVETPHSDPSAVASDQTDEKMEATSPVATEIKPVRTASASPRSRTRSSPQNNTELLTKLEPKQLPIAGKTIKREPRKTSSSSLSPTTSVAESKKKSKPSSTSPGAKAKKKRPPPKEDGHDGRNDFYCWVCHKEGEVLCCELCPRVFHAKCLNLTVEPEGDWFCPECEKITEAECKETQSRAMSMLTIDQFSLLLKYVIQRMKLPMSEPFHEPVDTKMFPDYLDYVFHPMDLSTIEKYVKKRKYGCPEAFLIDFKWVIHNCIIYNSPHSKLTQTAKAMFKIAERELNEIEVCPECYLNSCRKRDNWFCEPCKELHPLVWAKLQGFPHWPAKALRIEKGLVDVRFFGQHDRAWIPLSGCYLISKELPLPIKNRKKSKDKGLRGGLDGAMQEMQGYIENIKKITGEFEYAPPRTLLTHCDLYRKTGKTSQTGKQSSEADGKEMEIGASSKTDTGDSKARVELKDVGGTKELFKPRVPGLTTPKKSKTMTTSGEHPARAFGTKKKKASMEFLNKTIESCKASLGIEKIQDVKMNSGSDETSSSSEDEEIQTEETKPEEKSNQDVPGTSSKPPDEDDSDAELVIDLDDMEDNANEGKNDKADSSPLKTGDALMKKRKPEVETSSDKQLTPKPGPKSILHSSLKLTDKDERKKMLAKALSEKIGKRKHGTDDSPIGSSPSTKIRRTHDQHERRSGSPVDFGQKLAGKSVTKDKDRKKSSSHLSGKHTEKDVSGKLKSAIMKPSTELGGQRKDGHTFEKRPTDPLLQKKHKEMRDGAQKPLSKKSIPADKLGKIDKIPTGADVRKLFNGGRIPRKNPISSMSDDEPVEKADESLTNMEMSQTPEMRRRSTDRTTFNPHSNGTRPSNLQRQTSTEPSRKMDESVAMANLKKYSDKVMDTVQKVFYEMYTDMMVPLRSNAGSESNAATAPAMHEVAQMRLELERLKWMHEQEIAELKHNHDLTVAEIRQSLEYEKKQLLLDAKVQAETAKTQAINETKRKQWCAFCNKEAIFYCCWNTSYCDYPCQQKHWPQHMNSCTQARESGGQPAAMETMTSPPADTSVSKFPPTAMPAQGNMATSTLISKPTTKSTLPGSATITASSSSLTTGAKSGIVVATATQKQVPATISKPPPKGILVNSSANTAKTQRSTKSDATEKTHSSQFKGGLAISAIGARLLAAKQQSNDSEQPVVKKAMNIVSLESEDVAISNSDLQASTETMTDHVKTTMQSPMSPDAKAPAPKSIISSLFTEEISKPSSEEPTKKVSRSLVKVEAGAMTEEQTLTKTQIVSSKPKVSKINEVKLLNLDQKIKTGTKPHSAIFSSPSAVASLIADMGTPLSSTLSSPESSSFSDTPEKKTDTSKVQLSLAGSAFTKVVPDMSKPAVQSESTKVIDKTETFLTKAVSSESPSATFKPIDEKISNEPTESGENKVTVPVVAPVLADSYLSSLQKTLVKKSAISPVSSEIVEARNNKSDAPSLVSQSESDTPAVTMSKTDELMEIDKS